MQRIAKAKEELVTKLNRLVEEERHQLETDVQQRIEALESMRARHRREEEDAEKEIAGLTEKLERLNRQAAANAK